MLLSIGIAVGSSLLVAGCGGSQEGTSATFKPEEHKQQQDAMRAYMEKQKSSMAGGAKKSGK